MLGARVRESTTLQGDVSLAELHSCRIVFVIRAVLNCVLRRNQKRGPFRLRADRIKSSLVDANLHCRPTLCLEGCVRSSQSTKEAFTTLALRPAASRASR